MAEVIILTGISGAGKSSALFVFEEMGYYCVENIPMPLLPSMFQLAVDDQRYKKTVIAVNISDAKAAIEEAKKLTKLKFRVICLDCTTVSLLSRYKLTRHVHPLQTKGNTLEKAIAIEKEYLDSLRILVDVMIDTSNMEIGDLRKKIFANFQNSKGGTMTVSFVSFGFKYGIPSDVDLIIDTRILPNPFYINELKALTGEDKPVAEYLENLPQTKDYLNRAVAYLDFYLDKVASEFRPYYVVGVGCSGGQHRSVYIADWLARHYDEKFNTVVSHRDISRLKGQ